MSERQFIVLSENDRLLGFFIVEPRIITQYSFKAYSNDLSDKGPAEWQSFTLAEVKEKYPSYKLLRCEQKITTNYKIEETFI